MEKKETRIKCSGCGTSYKVKVPVTDKPVSFKCKKCGKVLKLKIKPAASTETGAESPPQPSMPRMPELETTQLPDMGPYQDLSGPEKIHRPSVVEHLFLDHPEDAFTTPPDKSRSWIVLADDVIKGPLSDQEITKMIERGEIRADTSLRMGERPWIKASEIQDFRHLFPDRIQEVSPGKPSSLSLLRTEGLAHLEDGKPPETPFYRELHTLMSYPFAGSRGLPLIIFAAIAFLLATVLSFDFLVGLPLNLVGWVLLYGYLAELMQVSIQGPDSPPPAWNFSRTGELASSGLCVLVLLMVCSLVPVGICLLLMIFFFLNSMPMYGYIFFALTILVYIGSLVVLPSGLVVLGATGRVGSALNPSKIMGIIKNGGQPYSMLVAVSLAAGLACMLAAVAGVFLVDVPGAGFVISGLVMALILSYGHFIWFHVLGRFATENRKLMKQVVLTGAS